MTCARIGTTDHATLAMQVAAADFHDPLRLRIRRRPARRRRAVRRPVRTGRVRRGPFRLRPMRRDNPALHIAAITFDTTSDGIVPVARSHAELLAGGLGRCSLKAGSRRIRRIAVVHARRPPSPASHLTLVPWLLSRRNAAAASAVRCRDALSAQLRGAVMRSRDPARDRWSRGSRKPAIFAPPRRPEKHSGLLARARAAAAQRRPGRCRMSNLIDVAIFGEIGLCAVHRADGKPAPLPSGKIRAPRGSPRAVIVADIARTPAGTIGFGGPMAPRHAFPPGAEQSCPHLFQDRRRRHRRHRLSLQRRSADRRACGDRSARRPCQCRRLSFLHARRPGHRRAHRRRRQASRPCPTLSPGIGWPAPAADRAAMRRTLAAHRRSTR